jgi:hypothetical protein
MGTTIQLTDSHKIRKTIVPYHILVAFLENLLYKIVTKKEKIGGSCFCCLVYGRFLSSRTIVAMPTRRIATIMPMTDGMKYVSVIDGGASVGAGVTFSSITLKAVVALEPQ